MNAQKIVLTSLINLSGTKAHVLIGDRPFVTLYRDDGAWHAQTLNGTQLLPRIPHTLRAENGEIKGEIKLGVMIKFLRDTVEAKLKGLERPAVPELAAPRGWRHAAA